MICCSSQNIFEDVRWAVSLMAGDLERERRRRHHRARDGDADGDSHAHECHLEILYIAIDWCACNEGCRLVSSRMSTGQRTSRHDLCRHETPTPSPDKTQHIQMCM